MKSCTDWHRLDTGTSVHLERKNLSFYWTSEQSFSSNSCWHNHIKNTSLNLTFNIFIRLTHASVVVTVQSKSVKDYSLQFSVRISALFAELKHFDDHNCAKRGKHFLNQTPFWSCSNGHVISATTNHWSGKLTELHSFIAVLWFIAECMIGFLHFQKWAYLCKIVSNNCPSPLKKRNHTAIF